MECNKDEALRAKQIAEHRMQIGDFVGALKFATKAKILFPDTPNIAQIVTVCEVHCAAQPKPHGSEMDWYEILRVDRSADEATIKKQYRKLALHLHPDKNNYAGAEAAFKLVGQANGVLGDQSRRLKYDMTCRISAGTKPPSHHPNASSFGTMNGGTAKNYHQSAYPHSHSSNSHLQDDKTFWTICQHCNTRYQYYKTIVNATLRCQQCSKLFKAHDLGFQHVPPEYTWTFNNYKQAPKHMPPKPSPERNAEKPFGRGQDDKLGKSNPVSMTKCSAGVDGKYSYVAAGGSKPAAATSRPDASKAKESGTSANVGRKRARQSASDSRENNKAGIGTAVNNTKAQEKAVGSSGHAAEVHPKRSSCKKKHVSNAETSQHGDFGKSPKRQRQDGSLNTTKVERKEGPTGVGGQSGEVRKEASSPPEEALLSNKTKVEQSHLNKKDSKSDNSTSDSGIVCPDPEFSDFEKGKAGDCFAAGQFWAIYDDSHSMPRFYALVKKVSSSPFKLHFTWLEANPDEQGAVDWVEAGLPVGCGKYTLGKSQRTDSTGMFSHQTHVIKGSGRSCYVVYPRMGETWAIFKDWDIGWSSDPEKHSEPPFEYVEVLSDFDDKAGIKVAYLGKVNGFVSIFQQAMQNGIGIFCVPCDELYRFSHRIPSCKMTGDEREGVPRGSFELDPAALPSYIFEVCHPGDVKMGDKISENGVNQLHHESSNCKVDKAMAYESICKAKFNGSNDDERVSSILRRSPRSNRKSKDKDQEITSDTGREDGKEKLNGSNDDERVSSILRRSSRSNRKSKDNDQEITSDTGREDGKDNGQRDFGQTGGIASSCQAEKDKIPQNHGKNNYEKTTLNARRSPRGLSRINGQVHAAESTADKVVGTRSNANRNTKDRNVNSEKDYIVVGSLSFNFKKDKSVQSFKCDQIWAIYSDRDKLPEIYAQIKKVESTPDFRLHVSLLEPCTETKGKRTMSCGIFNVKKAKSQILPPSAFSHQVKVKPMAKNRYEIYPRKGEIWALYKGKNNEPSSSDQRRGECHIVEVLEDTDESMQVAVLVHVGRSQPFFKTPRIQRSKAGVIEVPREDVARFSHQIPAFQHKGEDDAHFRECWVLDPSSIPGFVVRID